MLQLDAKLAVPTVRAGSVSRADLIARLRASSCQVVGITAPAGYGTSTLLAQWAAAKTRRFAWVSFDRFDATPPPCRRSWPRRTRRSPRISLI